LISSNEEHQFEEIVEGVIIILLNVPSNQEFNGKILDINNSYQRISKSLKQTISILNQSLAEEPEEKWQPL
jgi:hypothetical protein